MLAHLGEIVERFLLGRVADLGAQAAAFGKSFLEAYNPTDYVQTTKILRVLNAVRDYKVGLPLTWEEYGCHCCCTCASY